MGTPRGGRPRAAESLGAVVAELSVKIIVSRLRFWHEFRDSVKVELHGQLSDLAVGEGTTGPQKGPDNPDRATLRVTCHNTSGASATSRRRLRVGGRHRLAGKVQCPDGLPAEL